MKTNASGYSARPPQDIMDRRKYSRWNPYSITLAVLVWAGLVWLCVHIVQDFATSWSQSELRHATVVQEYPNTVQILRALDSPSYRQVAPPDVIKAITQPGTDPTAEDIGRRIGALTECRRLKSTDEQGNARRYTDDEIESCYVTLRITPHLTFSAPN